MTDNFASERVESFDFGRVISRTFLCLRRNFIPFFLAAAVIVGIPLLVITVIGYSKLSGVFASEDVLEALAENVGVITLWSAVTIAITLIANAILLGSLTYGSIRDFNDEASEFGELLRVRMKYALPLVGLSILSGIGMVLGFVFFIIPGLILLCIWFVITPALVMENVGVMGAFERSADLTKGYRWWLFLAFIVYVFASYFISALGEAIAVPMGIGAESVLLQDEMNMFVIIAASIMGVLIQVLQSVLMTVGIASIYYELRYIKEGIHPESIVAVFD